MVIEIFITWFVVVFVKVLTWIIAEIMGRSRRSAFSAKFMNITERISSVEKPSVKNKSPRIAFSKTSDLTPIASNLFRCPKSKTDIECANKTSEFKNKILHELTKSVGKTSEDNIYNVDYQSETNQTRKPPQCMLLNNKIKLLRKKNPPFNVNKLGQLFPKHKLFRKSKGNSCIIVSSAGSLTGSNAGSFIGKFSNLHPQEMKAIDEATSRFNLKQFWVHDGFCECIYQGGFLL